MRKIAAAVLVLVIVVAVWWYASPIWTLRAIQDAAKAHDAARLSAYVDYPALREDFKTDLRGYVRNEAAKETQGGGGALGAALAMAFLGPIVDATVTPDGVEAMFDAQARDSAGRRKTMPVSAGDHPVIVREGLDSFRVHGKDPAKGALIFRRHGLGWKLAGVDLPHD